MGTLSLRYLGAEDEIWVAQWDAELNVGTPFGSLVDRYGAVPSIGYLQTHFNTRWGTGSLGTQYEKSKVALLSLFHPILSLIRSSGYSYWLSASSPQASSSGTRPIQSSYTRLAAFERDLVHTCIPFCSLSLATKIIFRQTVGIIDINGISLTWHRAPVPHHAHVLTHLNVPQHILPPPHLGCVHLQHRLHA